MRASRLLSILMLLQTRGRVSARVMADHLQVSLRTIYRDVDQLSAAGVPVWAQTGRLGGICLREGWRTQLTGLTTGEAKAVFLAGLPGPAAQLGLGEAMSLAQLKLLAALPAETRADAERTAQRFHLDPSDWFTNAVPPPQLQTVADAVWNCRQLAMRYASWSRVRDHIVEPLGLVLKAGVWYMVARRAGSDDARPWRLAAIESLRLLDRGFVPPASFHLPAWWRDNTARFEAGVYTATATLQVDQAGFERVCRFSPLVARAAEESVRLCDEEGWVQVKVPIESVAHASREMLRLGEHARVLAPRALRRALLETARLMMVNNRLG
jgi:predicted DNA-binding transcriptional regulator YafY